MLNKTENFRAAIKNLLASTAGNPLDVPKLKTPYIELAKSMGYSHTEGREFANLVLAAFQKRADAAQVKADAKAAATRANHALMVSTLRKLVTAQTYWMDVTSHSQIKTALTDVGVKLNKKILKYAVDYVLQLQLVDCFKANYRHCVNGIVKGLVTDYATVRQIDYLDWDLYRGSYKGRPAKIKNTEIYVRKDYYKRVSASDLCVANDMLVLDAKKVGMNIWKVLAIKQGRGNDVTTVELYLARSGSIEAVAATKAEAIKKLAKLVASA